MLEAAFAAGLTAGASTCVTSAWCRPRRWRAWPPTRRRRRGDLGVAQPVRRQRHQALRRRRPQALRRRSRTRIEPQLARSSAVRARPGRPAPASARSHDVAPDAVGRYAAAVVDSLERPAARRAARRHRLRQRCGVGGRARRAARARRRGHGARTPSPTARNINDGCGSTHPEALQAAVVDAGPSSGWPSTATPTGCSPSTPPARSSTVTRSSPVRGRPATSAAPAAGDDTVVVTVMTNLGFRLAMADARHRRRRDAAVGDRYVLEALEAGGWSLGGEQSGHVIFARPRHHRRRPAHRRPAARRRARARARRSASWRSAMTQPAAGAAQRRASPIGGAATTPRRSGAAVRRRRSRAGRGRAGCCCGRAAPSRSCG